MTEKQFPKDFVWGVATSSYQIEGAVAQDGRAPSIWDTFSHTPGKVNNGDNGDFACDHYNRYKDDVALIADLGVDSYRFSIAWPRVQPAGAGAWNEKGWDFYARLLDELDRRKLNAHATLYHWDLPQALEDKGGWRNRDTAQRFTEYAVEFVRRFGARVKTIATHNEPWCTAILGHEQGKFAPGMKDRAAAYLVSHHLLLSHGMAVKAMREAGCTAKLGIVVNQSPAYPADLDSESDRKEARTADGVLNRWYTDPLFGRGYPADVLAWLGADAPEVSAPDLETIAQPIDFLGINYYSRIFSSAATPPVPAPAKLGLTDIGWEIYPDGLAEHLIRVSRDYNVPLYVTENGAADADRLEGDQVHDALRLDYYKRHLAAVAQARAMGADVRGYFAWSLMDNFEWAEGYDKRFGLVYVDYQTQRRVLKDSALWYRDFIRAQNTEA